MSALFAHVAALTDLGHYTATEVAHYDADGRPTLYRCRTNAARWFLVRRADRFEGRGADGRRQYRPRYAEVDRLPADEAAAAEERHQARQQADVLQEAPSPPSAEPLAPTQGFPRPVAPPPAAARLQEELLEGLAPVAQRSGGEASFRDLIGRTG